MKYSTKRSKDFISYFVKRSTLIMTLAFAMLCLVQELKAEERENKNDSDAIAIKEDSKITARKVFERLEIPALELLPARTRLDMLDYWDADSVYKASNLLFGLSWIDNMNDSYIKVRITDVSSLEIKILPGKKEKEEIIMTVYSVGADAQATDSDVNFYDIDLKEIPSNKHLEIPELKDFFEIPKGSLTSMKEIREMIPFPTVSYSANPDNDSLNAALTVEDFVSADDWNIIKLFLKPGISAEWKKEKYKFK